MDPALTPQQALARLQKRLHRLAAFERAFEQFELLRHIDQAVRPTEVVEPVKAVKPVNAEAVEPVKAKIIDPPVEVKVPEKEAVKPPEIISDKTGSASNTKWYILGGLAVVFLFPIALASTIFLFLEIWSRMSR